MPVMITCPDLFSGIKTGLITGPCKYDDGILVNLSDNTGGTAKYVCVQTSRGHTIQSLLKEDDGTT